MRERTASDKSQCRRCETLTHYGQVCAKEMEFQSNKVSRKDNFEMLKFGMKGFQVSLGSLAMPIVNLILLWLNSPLNLRDHYHSSPKIQSRAAWLVFHSLASRLACPVYQEVPQACE